MRFFAPAVLISILLIAADASADPVLYGGNGGHPDFDGSPLSIDNGWLVTVDQATGVVSPIGHPAGVARISGLAFATSDVLYATTLGGGGFPDTPPAPNPSHLIQINPDTGALIRDVGLIRNGSGGTGISIADLAIQPGTGVLYGIESREAAGGLGSPFGILYTIDKQTGMATLVGSTGLENASLAFASDGTLYATSARVNPADPLGPLIDLQVNTIDVATGKVLTSVDTSEFYTALAFDNQKGLLLGGTGSGSSLLSGDIYSIDPATGLQIAHISDTGLDFIGDLDVRPTPTPEPTSLTLAALGLLTTLGCKYSRVHLVISEYSGSRVHRLIL